MNNWTTNCFLHYLSWSRFFFFRLALLMRPYWLTFISEIIWGFSFYCSRGKVFIQYGNLIKIVHMIFLSNHCFFRRTFSILSKCEIIWTWKNKPYCVLLSILVSFENWGSLYLGLIIILESFDVEILLILSKWHWYFEIISFEGDYLMVNGRYSCEPLH